MKVELDNVTLGYSPLTGNVFAGITLQNQQQWRHKKEVTGSFVACVIHKYKHKTEVLEAVNGERWEITVKKISNMDDESQLLPLEVGDYVHYTPDAGPKENGRIKSIGSGGRASVVYKCAGEWDKYKEYTGAVTELNRLSRGWIDGDQPKQ